MKRFRAAAHLAALAALAALLASRARADAWLPVTAAPLARGYVAVAADAGVTIFVAGGSNGTLVTNAFQAYDSASDAWVSLPPMPTSRAGLALACVSGTVFAIGGTAGEPGLTANEAYLRGTGTWVTRAAMPTARRWVAGAAIGGTIYVTGGVISGTILATVEAYYPATNTWASLPPMPTPRFLHAAVVMGGRLWCIGGATALFGGSNNNNVKIEYLGTVEVYDPATRTWAQKSPMPTGRAGCGAASPGNGLLYAVGGITALGSAPLTERYDPGHDTWDRRADLGVAAALPDPAAGRHGLGVASPPGSLKLYALCGEQSGAPVFDATGTWVTSGTLYSAVERYDRSPASLSATLVLDPIHVAVGSDVTVYLDVMNLGDATATPLAGSLGILAGGAAVSLQAGPISASWFSGGLAPGERTRFAWRYDASAAGLVWFTATAAGNDAETAAPVSASAWNDLPLTAANRVRLAASLDLSPLPLVAGQVLTVTLTVSNTAAGTATAWETGPTLKILQGASLLALRSGPAPTAFSVTMTALGVAPANSVTVFTWTYSVSGAGFALLSVTVTGRDDIFGKRKAFASRTTMPSAPAGVAARQADASTLLTWFPNPGYERVTGYAVYRSTVRGFAPSPGTLVATTTASWFADSGLVNGTTYEYLVVAFNADGPGPPSAGAVTTPAQIPDLAGDVRLTSTGPSPLSFNPDRGERAQFLVNAPPGGGTLRVTLYSLAGEEVREAFHGAVPPGKMIAEWDGRNGRGRIVASGGYLAVIMMPDGKRLIRRVAVLR